MDMLTNFCFVYYSIPTFLSVRFRLRFVYECVSHSIRVPFIHREMNWFKLNASQNMHNCSIWHWIVSNAMTKTIPHNNGLSSKLNVIHFPRAKPYPTDAVWSQGHFSCAINRNWMSQTCVKNTYKIKSEQTHDAANTSLSQLCTKR